MKKAIIFHSEIPPDAPPDELDVLHEAEFIKTSLEERGIEVMVSPFTSDIGAAGKAINEHKPDFIFNLVETMFGTGRLIHVAPAYFDSLNIPFSGCPTDAIYLTSNKLTAKKLMKGYGLPTAKFVSCDSLESFTCGMDEQYIVKSVWEHASVGIDEHSFSLLDSTDAITGELEKRKRERNESFAECYIDGREFNISMIGGKNGPQVLPFAEICFVDYPDDKPKVVGYRAKWDEESFEYSHTVRNFEYPESDQPLLEKLEILCHRCWNLFGLKGYARVDFRVDMNGNPFILEINANPCISPDSGFVAACNMAGISAGEMMERILEDIF
ncbi:MAG: D-alanine--D-alanine ligase [Bacteroidota bacterium]